MPEIIDNSAEQGEELNLTFSQSAKQEILQAIKNRLLQHPIKLAEFRKQNLYNRLQTEFTYGRRGTEKTDEIGYADEFVLFIILLTQAIFKPFYISLCVRNKTLEEVLLLLFEQIFQIKPDRQCNKSSVTLLIRRSKEKRQITDFLRSYFAFDPDTYGFHFYAKNLEAAEKRSILQALFLAAASLADPSLTYQLEFICRRCSVYELLHELLVEINLVKVRKSRHPRKKRKKIVPSKLVLRSGDAIGSFLLFIGIQQKLLEYENIRINRHLRGDVNRVVNCDNYNLSKTVNVAIEQVKEIMTLQNSALWDSLSEDLKFVAQLRLDNPECSLKELQDFSTIKYSRNGLYYRLRKLHNLATAAAKDSLQQTID